MNRRNTIKSRTSDGGRDQFSELNEKMVRCRCRQRPVPSGATLPRRADDPQCAAVRAPQPSVDSLHNNDDTPGHGKFTNLDTRAYPGHCHTAISGT
jgi:hypothetical protein